MLREYFYSDAEAMTSALLDVCASTISGAVGQRGRASLLLSGGRTPEPLYRRLGEMSLPWNEVSLALVDERWVGEDDERSNARFLRESLMAGPAAAAKLVTMKTEAPTPEAGAADCEQRYRSLPRPYDLALLGMGSDGHTASLFPGAEGLAAAFDTRREALCAPIRTADDAASGVGARMSLSLRALLSSRQIVLVMTGEAKLARYREARAYDDPQRWPVAAILRQPAVPVSVYWAPEAA